MDLFTIAAVVIGIIAVMWYWRRGQQHAGEAGGGTAPLAAQREPEPPSGDIVVLSYPGRTQADAAVVFQQDAQRMATWGYAPVSQSWAEGRPGAARVVALGIFSTAIRPAGYLTVTYQRRQPLPQSDVGKVCPRCAETVKSAALVCRFCGYEFAEPV